MKLIISDDMVAGTIHGVADGGVALPGDLSGVSIAHLRFDGKNVIDARAIEQFYVDSLGVKHLTDAAERQWVACTLTDRLVLHKGKWRKMTGREASRRTKAARMGFPAGAFRRWIGEAVKIAAIIAVSVLLAHVSATGL